MNSTLFWLGALVVVAVLLPVLKLTIAALFGKAVGEMALASQPEHIHLEHRDESLWKDAARAGRIASALRSRGYEDAGIYAVNEMPGVVVQLLAHAREGFYAAICEHPEAGMWIDLASKFQDDGSYTLTTSKATGLAPRPGHDVTHAPGLEIEAAIEKARSERPRKWFRPVSTGQAVSDFQQAYAESIAYRRQVGITRGEVMKVATRKAA
jgi:hypothetical protein